NRISRLTRRHRNEEPAWPESGRRQLALLPRNERRTDEPVSLFNGARVQVPVRSRRDRRASDESGRRVYLGLLFGRAWHRDTRLLRRAAVQGACRCVPHVPLRGGAWPVRLARTMGLGKAAV